jgi:hypothetical protein
MLLSNKVMSSSSSKKWRTNNWCSCQFTKNHHFILNQIESSNSDPTPSGEGMIYTSNVLETASETYLWWSSKAIQSISRTCRRIHSIVVTDSQQLLCTACYQGWDFGRSWWRSYWPIDAVDAAAEFFTKVGYQQREASQNNSQWAPHGLLEIFGMQGVLLFRRVGTKGRSRSWYRARCRTGPISWSRLSLPELLSSSPPFLVRERSILKNPQGSQISFPIFIFLGCFTFPRVVDGTVVAATSFFVVAERSIQSTVGFQNRWWTYYSLTHDQIRALGWVLLLKKWVSWEWRCICGRDSETTVR